jgi:hypothetical protein
LLSGKSKNITSVVGCEALFSMGRAQGQGMSFETAGSTQVEQQA